MVWHHRYIEHNVLSPIHIKEMYIGKNILSTLYNFFVFLPLCVTAILVLHMWIAALRAESFHTALKTNRTQTISLLLNDIFQKTGFYCIQV